MISTSVEVFCRPKEVSFLKWFNYLPLSESDAGIVNQ